MPPYGWLAVSIFLSLWGSLGHESWRLKPGKPGQVGHPRFFSLRCLCSPSFPILALPSLQFSVSPCLSFSNLPCSVTASHKLVPYTRGPSQPLGLSGILSQGGIPGGQQAGQGRHLYDWMTAVPLKVVRAHHVPGQRPTSLSRTGLLHEYSLTLVLPKTSQQKGT